LPKGLGARLGRRSWEEPPIFALMQERGRISEDEMFGTFNMGLGMILVVDRDEVPRSAQVIGEVVEHTTGERVVIR
jgi:phosphoribosylformylglycinamidine cyclo-ligase